ncbi:MAG: hypothetical protein ACOC8L_11965 [Spirochaetota bacterium]
MAGLNRGSGIAGREPADAPLRRLSDRQGDSPLTAREKQVLQTVADGNTHLTSVFDKLGVDTRAAAIACAVEKGWL